MAFDDVIDAIRDSIKGSTPDYLPNITWEEAPLSAPLEEQELAPRSQRHFQVIDGPVVEIGDYVSPGYELVQHIQVVLRYIHDRRQGSEWYDLRKMASTDAGRLIDKIIRPPVGDWSDGGILNLSFDGHDPLEPSDTIQGAWEQRLTFAVLHTLPATTESIRSLLVKRYGTYTALRAGLAAVNLTGALARLVNSSTLERIADYRWTGSAPLMVGVADLTVVGDGTTGVASYTTTAGGDIRPNDGGTVTLTYGSGVVVATAGADYFAVQESATLDQLHVGTHGTYGTPQQAGQWVGEHFSAGALPAAGTAGRLAAVVAEASGARTTEHRDGGTAWYQLYDPTLVPSAAGSGAYSHPADLSLAANGLILDSDDSSRPQRYDGAAWRAQYDQGDVPTYGSTGALEGATLYGDKIGSVGGTYYRVIGGTATELVVPASKIAAYAAAALPQTDTATLFTVTGRIRILGLSGLVTVQIGSATNDTKIQLNPTTGATADLCATTDIDGNTAGYLYAVTGETTDALSAGDGAVESLTKPVDFGPGTIELVCAGSDGGTGRVSWDLSYVAITSDGAAA